MLVVSMSDFVNNESYKKAPYRLVDNGAVIGTFFPKKTNSFFLFFKNLFKTKERSLGFLEKENGVFFTGVKNGKRPIAPLKGKVNLVFSEDWEMTPEEIFDDIDDLNGSMKNFTRQG